MVIKEEELHSDDLAGLHAFGADKDPFDGAAQIGFDFLQIGQEGAESFSNDLGPGAAFTTDHTASFIFIPRRGAFFADCA